MPFSSTSTTSAGEPHTDDASLVELPAFDFHPRTRMAFGVGRMAELGNLCRECGGTRVLLVTDHGIERAGHSRRALEILAAAKLDITVFDEVRPNPTTEDVDRGLAIARRNSVDVIVGLGGGSSMDCAKGINFLLTNGGKIEDYWGYGKASRPMLPMIAVPTTAGTGSEAQSFAVIAHATTHMKMACGDPKAACRVALLDPELTLSLPASVTAATGIDAMSHAVESYVCTKRNPISRVFSRKAWKLLSHGFPAVLRDPSSLGARSRMLLGAHLAGAAIENSMLGAAHALANPLSAHFDLTHGIAVGIMLPHVVRFNADVVRGHYGQLAHDAGLCAARDPAAPELLAGYLIEMSTRAGLPTTLADCGVKDQTLTVMAREAATQWTGKFNPKPVNAETLEELYRCAL